MRERENQQRQRPVQLSPMDEIGLVEHQCKRCFAIEDYDMRTPHGGENIDQQAAIEPVDISQIDEPGLISDEDLLGGL